MKLDSDTFFEKKFMNKLLILTTCITPLLFINANAKYSDSAPGTNQQQIETAKHAKATLDQYMRIKCNLPKISDQQARDTAENALAIIANIENIPLDNITASLQEYCSSTKDSAFGKIMEVAQDLIPIAKSRAEFDNVIKLEKISNRTLDLYNIEETNFEALAKNTTDTPEYKENEEKFKKFMSKDLKILEQIALQYAGKSIEKMPEISSVDNKDTVKEASHSLPDSETSSKIEEVSQNIEQAPVVSLDQPFNEKNNLTSDKVSDLDKETTNSTMDNITEQNSIFEKKEETSESPKINETSVFATKEIKEDSPFASEEKSDFKPEFSQEKATETNPFVAPIESNKEDSANEISSQQQFDSETRGEISQEKPFEVTPFSSNKPTKEISSEMQTLPEDSQITHPENVESKDSAVSNDNKEEIETPLLPHSFSEKSVDSSEQETAAKTDSSEKKDFWGF